MMNTIISDLLGGIVDTIVKNNATRGTGAGGAMTNTNGLSYERLTSLSTEYSMEKKCKHHTQIRFRCAPDVQYVRADQANLFKYLAHCRNTNICGGHGCTRPDECYIDETARHIFIIEKKFQQCSGSVCEKIQTSEFKLWQYGRVFPDYKIVYMYCLSGWFKDNCKAELEYLAEKKIPTFYGDAVDYKTQIIHYITTYNA